MDQKQDSRLYVSMMVDSLKKKRDVLTSLFGLTLDQEALLRASELDADSFMGLVDSKGEYIDELDKLDEGFDRLYKRFEHEIIVNRDAYGTEISRMKDLISDITDLGSKIQVMEKKNDERFKLYIKNEKSRLRSASQSQQTAMAYAQNMIDGRNASGSLFINETH